MPLVDWRELYASNQAVIEQARRRAGDPAPTVRLPPASRTPGPTVPEADQRTLVVAGRRRRVLVHVPRGLEAGVAVPLRDCGGENIPAVIGSDDLQP